MNKTWLKQMYGSTLIVLVLVLVLLGSTPLLAHLTGYGYGNVKKIVNDLVYQGSLGKQRQTFLVAGYDDNNIKDIKDYQLLFYGADGLELLHEVSLRQLVDLPEDDFVFTGMDPMRTTLSLVADANADNVPEIRLTIYSRDVNAVDIAGLYQESWLVFDGETGSLLDSLIPSLDAPNISSLGYSMKGLKSSYKNGALTIRFKNVVTNNLFQKQKAFISSVIERPDGGYEAGETNSLVVAADTDEAYVTKLKLPPHYPIGDYKVITTVSSKKQAPYSVSFIVKKNKSKAR